MRYVIMANGKGTRWGLHGGIPKHLIECEGEPLIARTARLVREADPSAEVILSSGNAAYDACGIARHTPAHGELEWDRFCRELVECPVCFLYGDVYYTPQAMRAIVEADGDPYCFLGSESSIYAAKLGDWSRAARVLDEHRARIEAGELPDGKGWQLYHALAGMELPGRARGTRYHLVADATRDFNTPADLEAFRADTEAQDAQAHRDIPDTDLPSGTQDDKETPCG